MLHHIKNIIYFVGLLRTNAPYEDLEYISITPNEITLMTVFIFLCKKTHFRRDYPGIGINLVVPKPLVSSN